MSNEPEWYKDIVGCSNHFCWITGRETGQATNGPCRCLRDMKLATKDRLLLEKVLTRLRRER